MLIATPFVKPFKWSRILFTYLIPVMPVTLWWDGLVSVMRTHSIEEMENMFSSIDNGMHFMWEAGKLKNKGNVVQYALGYRINNA